MFLQTEFSTGNWKLTNCYIILYLHLYGHVRKKIKRLQIYLFIYSRMEESVPTMYVHVITKNTFFVLSIKIDTYVITLYFIQFKLSVNTITDE